LGFLGFRGSEVLKGKRSDSNIEIKLEQTKKVLKAMGHWGLSQNVKQLLKEWFKPENVTELTTFRKEVCKLTENA
jgi:hypothetical protein